MLFPGVILGVGLRGSSQGLRWAGLGTQTPGMQEARGTRLSLSSFYRASKNKRVHSCLLLQLLIYVN